MMHDGYYNNVVVCADIVVRFMTRLVIQVPDRRSRLRPALTALKELLKVKLGIPKKKIGSFLSRLVLRFQVLLVIPGSAWPMTHILLLLSHDNLGTTSYLKILSLSWYHILLSFKHKQSVDCADRSGNSQGGVGLKVEIDVKVARVRAMMTVKNYVARGKNKRTRPGVSVDKEVESNF